MERTVFQVVLDPVTLEVSVVQLENGPTSRINRFHGKQITPFLKRL